MWDSTQILDSVALLLQRVLRRRRALHLYLSGVDFKWLFSLGSGNKLSGYNKGSAYVLCGYLLKVIDLAVLKYHLNALKAGAVV